MSTYLYSMDREQLTQSTSLSRLILALVSPFTQAANESFLAEARAERDAELAKLREEGEHLGFGSYDLNDPLDGQEGVRGKAFKLADASLPQALDGEIAAKLAGWSLDLNDAKEDFPRARQFIRAQAVAGTNILVL